MSYLVRCGVFVVLVLKPFSGDAGPILRIATWNVENGPKRDPDDRQAFTTVLEAIGPVDILALVETDTTSAADTVELLNALYRTASYQSVTSSADGGGDRTALVFDAIQLRLLDADEVVEELTHHAIRAAFQPTGLVAADALQAYAIHLKSDPGPAERLIRQSEAGILRQHADLSGQQNVLYAGDFNLVGTSEPAWDVLTAPGPGQAFDPVGAGGTWRGKREVITLHTHDAGEGLDDRFDLQLVSASLLDGQGLDYVTGSYKVLGNDGTHQLNEPITSGTGASPGLLSALALASDHLPVTAAYAYPYPAGDANGDYAFDEHDIVSVLIADRYLDGQAAAWSQGDWNGDRLFNQLDLVAALRSGRYLQGPPAIVVPEPTAVALVLPAAMAVVVLLSFISRPRRS